MRPKSSLVQNPYSVSKALTTDNDFRKKLAENTANYVSSQFYEHKPKPTVKGAIKVHKTHKHLDYLESEDDLPLVSEVV